MARPPTLQFMAEQGNPDRFSHGPSPATAQPPAQHGLSPSPSPGTARPPAPPSTPPAGLPALHDSPAGSSAADLPLILRV
eukprot:3163639-Prymnesium_polylepis.3